MNEIFVLALVENGTADASVVRVMRTYLSEKRAEQDRELLTMADPNHVYRVVAVDYIDD